MKSKIKIIYLMMIFVNFLSSCSDNNSSSKMYGDFITLSEGYEKKFLTYDNLINIAYWNNKGKVYNQDGNEKDYDPGIITSKVSLDDQIKEEIISDFYYTLLEDEYFQAEAITISDIKISVYCGTYNNLVSLRFVDNEILGAVTGQEVIDDLLFKYPYDGGNKVLLWKK